MFPRVLRSFSCRVATGVMTSLLLAEIVSAQSSIRGWGLSCTDTDAREGVFVHVDAGPNQSAVVREDGRIVCYGANVPFGNAETFPLPAGLKYQKVAMGRMFTLGLLSDGAVVGIGSLDLSGLPLAVPALPPGTSYVDIEASLDHALLLRSDGALLGIGWPGNHLNVPYFPPGIYPLQMAAAAGHSAVLLSDGSIVAFGRNTLGQCNVPPLPFGMRYVDLDAYGDTTAAIRSDGQLLVWGSNRFGQGNVPPGAYLKVASGGSHTVALRTDGVLVAFGDNSRLQLNIPAVPPGLVCKELACGGHHTVALMSDGTVMAWGNDTFQQTTVPVIPDDLALGGRARILSVAAGGPYNACVLSDGTLMLWGHQYLSSIPLPANEKFSRVELGWGTAVAMRTDGSLVAWGDNTFGRATVPVLPPGVHYVAFDETWSHTVAIRSDGYAEQFGEFNAPIPPLPNGLRYIDADAESRQTVLLRSDGVVLCPACAPASLSNVPALAPGLRYVDVTHCEGFLAALRSDGTLALWGGVGGASWDPLPVLPTGCVYVEISGGYYLIAARRSDGQVVVAGNLGNREEFVPPLQPGTSYVEVDGGDQTVAARVGPTSTYVSFYSGCSGSRPAARLVPADTPRIGATLKVRIFDLPSDLAFLALGFTRTQPVPLDFAGMPGCTAHITADAIDFAIGQSGIATVSVSIPSRQSLVGLHFFHQALVLDPAAGNVAGAVVSAAAEAVIGHW